MEHLGINVNVKNVPELDAGYIPLHKFNAAFLEGAETVSYTHLTLPTN